MGPPPRKKNHHLKAACPCWTSRTKGKRVGCGGNDQRNAQLQKVPLLVEIRPMSVLVLELKVGDHLRGTEPAKGVEILSSCGTMA